MPASGRSAKLANCLRVLGMLHERRGEWIETIGIARTLGVENRTVNSAVRSWQAVGVPIEERSERGTALSVRLSKAWSPSGADLGRADAQEVLHLLLVAARSANAEQLINTLIAAQPSASTVRGALQRVVTPRLTSQANDSLPVVLDALGEPPRVLCMRYFSARRRRVDEYVISPQRLYTHPQLQLLAIDHDGGDARRFRLDRVERISVDRREKWRAMDAAAIAAHSDHAFDEYVAEDGSVHEARFRVRDDDWSWVRGVFPASWSDEKALDGDLDGWTRVSMTTRGLPRLAAFLVGLGDAAVAESEELRLAMLERANGSIRANGGSRRPLNG